MFFTNKPFNLNFDNYTFRKNVSETMILDIDTQYNIKYNEKSMLHHIYLYTDEQREQNFSGEKQEKPKLLLDLLRSKNRTEQY